MKFNEYAIFESTAVARQLTADMEEDANWAET